MRAAPLVRHVHVGSPFALAATLAPLRTGPGDPTVRLSGDQAWRASRTPAGAATLRLAVDGDRVVAEAWGPGAEAALEAVPGLLGVHDDARAWEPPHPLVAALHRRHPGLRMTRSGDVIDALVRAIVEQKVTTDEAQASWRRLVWRHGEPAPGPGGLRLPPAPAALAALPYHAFHPLGVERRRADTVRRVCARAGRVEEAAAMAPAEAERRLLALPGVGPWTSALVRRVALGDPDAVEVGDYHIPNIVAWNLAGEARATDERMLELLAPFAGQRGRVVRLLLLGGHRAPKFGPRRPIRRLAAM